MVDTQRTYRHQLILNLKDKNEQQVFYISHGKQNLGVTFSHLDLKNQNLDTIEDVLLGIKCTKFEGGRE